MGNVNDFGLLKLKEKERKKRKKEAAFQNHVVESTDKLKEMSIRTAKIEKLSTETESELLKLREKALLMMQKSAAQEDEFEAIFRDIDNIDAMVFEGDKKNRKEQKKRKGKEHRKRNRKEQKRKQRKVQKKKERKEQKRKKQRKEQKRKQSKERKTKQRKDQKRKQRKEQKKKEREEQKRI